MTYSPSSSIHVHKRSDLTTTMEWTPKYAYAISDEVLAHMHPEAAEDMFKKIARDWAIQALDDIAGAVAYAAVKSGYFPEFTPKVLDLGPFHGNPTSYSLMTQEEAVPALKAKMRDAMDDAIVKVSPRLKAGYEALHKAFKSGTVFITDQVDKGAAKIIDSFLAMESHPSFGSDVVGALAKAIPGFKSMKQPCPFEKNDGCFGPGGPYLWNAIVHLNDHHKWTREQIADWLETLDHDLTMQPVGGGE